ncbi:GNAT family N-acetyltransferase [Xenorhabdus indica]|uniref:GNAT family N-acetyltransferase n=1 Tax=Xenorhabdus indica TaxID=333964 RepID=UPI001656D339|nr:GNAT family N-acetyltransferase [Xenorhabdus indica]
MIKEVSFSEGIMVARNIERNIKKEWLYEPNKGKKIMDFQKDWNERCHATLCMIRSSQSFLQELLFESSEQENICCFVAYIDGAPIGILIFSWKEESPRVKNLLTHPGCRDCGVLLMEKAVNKSKEYGRNGKVSLSPFSGSEQAYLRMGFDYCGKNEMILEPNKSNLWFLMDGEYTFKGTI